MRTSPQTLHITRCQMLAVREDAKKNALRVAPRQSVAKFQRLFYVQPSRIALAGQSA
jgi:hypothetical protein